MKKKIDLHIKNLPLEYFNRYKNDLITFIKDYEPDVVGFSCYTWNYKFTLELCEEIKEVCDKTKIVLGGPQVSPTSCEVLEKHKQVDFIVRDEGEVTFYELVKCMVESKHNFSNILGLSYKEGKKVKMNPDRPFIENLDDIPSPYLTGFLDLNKLSKLNPNWYFIETSRGCPYNCAYCYECKRGGRKLRYFSLERIKKELSLILKNKNVQRLFFLDSELTTNKERFEKLCQMIGDENVVKAEILFSAMLENFDAETIDSIKKMKSDVLIECGLQTTNPKVLKIIHRKFNKEIFSKNYWMMKKNGIQMKIDIILGLPEDNLLSFMKSLNYSFRLRPDLLKVFIYSLLPGTELYDTRERYNYEFDRENNNNVISNMTFSENDVKYASEKSDIVHSFIVKKFIIKKIFWLFTSPYRLKRVLNFISKRGITDYLKFILQ